MITQYYVNAAMGLWRKSLTFSKKTFARMAAVCIVFFKSCIFLFKKPERFLLDLK